MRTPMNESSLVLSSLNSEEDKIEQLKVQVHSSLQQMKSHSKKIVDQEEQLGRSLSQQKEAVDTYYEQMILQLQRDRDEALSTLETQKDTLQKDLESNRARTEDFNDKLNAMYNQLEKKQQTFFLDEENLADTLKDFKNQIEEVS